MGEKVYGLLGRKLGHSWSAPIHAALGCADYRLIELERENARLRMEVDVLKQAALIFARK